MTQGRTGYAFIPAVIYSDINKRLAAQGIRTADKHLLALVSGGPDSMFLLEYLRSGLENPPASLTVLNINYCLRGADSDSEQELVKKYCTEHGIDCHSQRCPLSGSGNLQRKARDIRLNEIRNIMSEKKIDYILTGHNHDDLLETWFLKMTRASGHSSLSSFAVSSKLPGGIRLVRPLLHLGKDRIYQAVSEMGIPFGQDKSNSKDIYRRNVLRNKVFPLLDEHFPSWRENLGRSAAYLDEASGYFMELIDRAEVVLQLRDMLYFMPAFRDLGSGRRHFLLNHYLHRAMPDQAVSSGQLTEIDRAVCQGSNSLLLENGCKNVCLNYGLLYAYEKTDDFEINLKPGEQAATGDYSYSLLKASSGVAALKDPVHFYFSCPDPLKSVSLRSRRQGDRLCNVGSVESKKLKDLLMDNHLPWDAREQAVVIDLAGVLGMIVPHTRAFSCLRERGIVKSLGRYLDTGFLFEKNPHKYVIIISKRV